MISRSTEKAGHLSSTFLRRRLIISTLVMINIFTEVGCSGVFQLKLDSFQNDRGYDLQGNCCSPSSSHHHSARRQPETKPCQSSCRTFFRICLRNFQVSIPKDYQCTYGQTTTGVLGRNSFDAHSGVGHNSSSSDLRNPINIPFNFTWPGSFSLIIEAWHDLTGRGPYAGSDRVLIAQNFIRKSLDVGDDWRPDVYVSTLSRLTFRYRVICSEHYYGPDCANMCTARNDDLGHYTCTQNGTRACLPGWTGEYCQTAVCLEGCNMTNGICRKPSECVCRSGWEGQFCNNCILYPGCQHGGCVDKWQCNCHEGWGGLFCNQDLNYCTNHQPCVNGATCKNTGEGSYTCDCPLGYNGTNCEIEVFDCFRQPCHSGGTCQTNDGRQKCHCPEGYSGRRCETTAKSCRDGPCNNGGTCWPAASGAETSGYKCECRPGFTGSNCELEIDECSSVPCLNGGKCIDEHGRYRCQCQVGYAGDRCEDDRNDCVHGPCLNGGTCVDGINRFWCRCPPGYTGELCQDAVDDCRTHPCANGAACLDLHDGFACRCAPGFGGRDCGLEIDECLSSPCGVHGACNDLLNGYRCDCDTGFTGTNCEVSPSSSLEKQTTSGLSLSSFSASSAFSLSSTSSGRFSSGPLHSTPPPPSGTDDPAVGTGIPLVALIAILVGLTVVFILAAVAVIIVVVVCRRQLRSPSPSAAPHPSLSEKLNNVRGGSRSKEEASDAEETDARNLQQQQYNQQQRGYLNFTKTDQVQMQRNINDLNNLKNVEKYKSWKRNALSWDNSSDLPPAGTAGRLAEADKHPENDGYRSNGSRVAETSTWKKRSDNTTRNVPSIGCLGFLGNDQTSYGESTIATEV